MFSNISRLETTKDGHRIIQATICLSSEMKYRYSLVSLRLSGWCWCWRSFSCYYGGVWVRARVWITEAHPRPSPLYDVSRIAAHNWLINVTHSYYTWYSQLRWASVGLIYVNGNSRSLIFSGVLQKESLHFTRIKKVVLKQVRFKLNY